MRPPLPASICCPCPVRTRQFGGPLKLNLGTLALILVAAFVFAQRAWGLPLTPSRIIGLSIAIPSLLMLCLARVQLGDAFSARAKASKLVTHGLYSRIRNPIYVFGALTIAGIIIWTGRPWLFVVFAVLIPLQVYRSRKESQVLEEKFGAAYLQYKQKTWL
jgi:protein-S-isoprenylcysteine O-methyltransferase Ste14